MLYNRIRNFITKRKSEDNMSLTNGAVTYRNLSDADEGKIVSFVYYGHGQNYGQLRHATVLEVLADGILAQEKNSGHPKHFKNAEAEDVKLEQDNSQSNHNQNEMDRIFGEDGCDIPKANFSTSEAKGVTFMDAKQMMSEAGWAKESVLDILSSEQLVEVFGAYHTAVGDYEAGEISYEWDADNGNILIHDHRNPISVIAGAGHDGMFKRIDFRVVNAKKNDWTDLRITVDQSGKVTLQENGNVISAVELTNSLLKLIES